MRDQPDDQVSPAREPTRQINYAFTDYRNDYGYKSVMLRTQFLKDTEKSHTCTDRNKIINNYREDK